MIKNFLKNIIDNREINILEKSKRLKYKDHRYDDNIEGIKPLDPIEKNYIDKYYMKNYGKKIPYIFHETYKSANHKFDVEYLPETLFIPKFEHFMNNKKEYAKSIEDKNFLPIVAKAAGVKMPKSIIYSIRDLFFDEENNIIEIEKAVDILSNYNGSVILKPSVDTCGGQKVKVINNAGELTSENWKEILDEYKTNFVIQEKIKNHKSMEILHPKSLQTLRVGSYYKDGDIKILPIIMRMGSGNSEIDNVSRGGLFIGVDNDGKLLETGYNEFGKSFKKHPDTEIVFKGHHIEHIEDLKANIKKIHKLLPQIGVVNWDFTIEEKGTPILIEANCICGGIIDMVQFAHGRGIFGEDTKEILRYIREEESKPFVQREKNKNYL